MATYGSKEEREEALSNAVKGIPLWRALFEKWGNRINAETFWIDLAEITGITRPESKNKADTVRKAYMDDIKYLSPVEKPSGAGTSTTGVVGSTASSNKQHTATDRTGIMEVPQSSTNVIGYIGFPEYSKAPIEIKDELSFKIAEQLLEAIRRKLFDAKRAATAPVCEEVKPSEEDVPLEGE